MEVFPFSLNSGGLKVPASPPRPRVTEDYRDSGRKEKETGEEEE
jgi:hypothetical protein